MQKKLMDTCTGLQHTGIPSGDLDRSCTFYTELGFEKVFQTVIGAGQRVAFMKFQDLMLELYEGEPVRKAGAVDHIAVNCTDVEAAYALAEEKGYSIVSQGIEELPFWEKGVRFFTIEGPDREKIEFNQYL